MVIENHSVPFSRTNYDLSTAPTVASSLIGAENQHMANSKNSSELPAHKRRVLIRPRLFTALEVLAKRNESELAELANTAIREMLQREGLWPPTSGKGEDE